MQEHPRRVGVRHEVREVESFHLSSESFQLGNTCVILILARAFIRRGLVLHLASRLLHDGLLSLHSLSLRPIETVVEHDRGREVRNYHSEIDHYQKCSEGAEGHDERELTLEVRKEGGSGGNCSHKHRLASMFPREREPLGVIFELALARRPDAVKHEAIVATNADDDEDGQGLEKSEVIVTEAISCWPHVAINQITTQKRHKDLEHDTRRQEETLEHHGRVDINSENTDEGQ
mmetsp:Transcript_5962/g.7732  ORF Transcript_5962/g.7732 Transcript_5962/m.7732 type:complete len:233 (-) Transcript_5962:1070-1768(-)